MIEEVVNSILEAEDAADKKLHRQESKRPTSLPKPKTRRNSKKSNKPHPTRRILRRKAVK